MKATLLILLIWAGGSLGGHKLYICKNAGIAIYSKAPLEDIEANSQKAVSVLNAETGEVDFSVPVSSLQFEKSLMQEHFNDDYMESDKYPQATFKGILSPNIDINKNGVNKVAVTGLLTVHGVAKQRTITGTITVKEGRIVMNSVFNVLCADHHIKIPQLVFEKIAESIRVQVSAAYTAYN